MKIPSIALCFTILGLGACEADNSGQHPNLTDIRVDWLVTPEEALEWALVKHNDLPTLTGSPEWLNYMSFLEATLDTYGLVDGTRNTWQFERWHTSEDSSQWSFSPDGESVRVANYGAYSGSTTSEGITAKLLYYDYDDPPTSIEGKIVVVPARKHPTPPFSDHYLINYTFNDYEYATAGEPLPDLFEFVTPSETFTFDSWWQLARGLDGIPREGNAAGAIIVYSMAFERANELYTFGMPTLYN